MRPAELELREFRVFREELELRELRAAPVLTEPRVLRALRDLPVRLVRLEPTV